MSFYLSTDYSLQEGKQGMGVLLRKADNILYRERMLEGWGRYGGVLQTLRRVLKCKDDMTRERKERLTVQTVQLARAAGLMDLNFTAIGSVGVKEAIWLAEAAGMTRVSAKTASRVSITNFLIRDFLSLYR